MHSKWLDPCPFAASAVRVYRMLAAMQAHCAESSERLSIMGDTLQALLLRWIEGVAHAFCNASSFCCERVLCMRALSGLRGRSANGHLTRIHNLEMSEETCVVSVHFNR